MFTNKQVMDALNGIATRLDALESTPAPVATGTPAKASAKSPAFGDKDFETYVADRRAAQVPCGIPAHGKSCNRVFSPKSSGATDHTARIV